MCGEGRVTWWTGNDNPFHSLGNMPHVSGKEGYLRDMAHAALLTLLHRWPTGAKNQNHFLLVCSNCQNI